METPSGWPSITPMYLFPMLDPALKASGASVFVTIRLLKKDITRGPWTAVLDLIKKREKGTKLTNIFKGAKIF